ncbi:hypothetical protein [Psychrobacillus psychrotolerans]|uniref:hypothetical protein n=1 Tax=Psychrobacillus psychrotolerans TaxID=126156 RepID=UPI00331469EC
MNPGKVQVKVGEKDLQINETLLMIDLNKLAVITSMSKRFLEDEILSDPRMRIIERRKSRKRWWLYNESLEVIKEIVDEW